MLIETLNKLCLIVCLQFKQFLHVAIYPSRLNNWSTSKSPEGYPDRQSPEEGRSAQQLKHCDNKKKGDGNRPSVNKANKDNSTSSMKR